MQTQPAATDHNAPLDLVWGGKNIAKVLGRSPMATFRLLEAGEIPGAKKVASRWCLVPSAFRASITA